MPLSMGIGEVRRKLPWLRRNNPDVQILLSSACLCFNPGFYNALTLLGAGGGQQSSAAMANIANSVLYGVFALAAIGAGSLLNIIGPRISLLFACTGYPVFSGAMWYFSVTGNLWYPVFAGAYLGFAAALLWTTAIFMANAYAEENSKARWRAVEWIFNMGGASIGAAVALGISWNATMSSVPPSVYITFIILQCCSSGFAFFVLPPEQLRRSDGTSLARFNRLSIRDSFNITRKLFKDWRVLILLPVMFTPEMFYPFQATINAAVFNLRTRTLNGLLNTLIQLPTTAILAFIMDNQRFGSRKKRVIIAITYNALLVTGSYIAQTAWLRAWKSDISLPGPEIDFMDKSYRGAVVIYLFYAAQYGTFQSCVLYVLATFTNDPRKSAAIGGLYVGVLSAGTATSFGLNASGVPFENINAALFSLSTLCWPILYYTAFNHVIDTNYGKEAEVVVPIHARRELGLKPKNTEIAE